VIKLDLYLIIALHWVFVFRCARVKWDNLFGWGIYHEPIRFHHLVHLVGYPYVNGSWSSPDFLHSQILCYSQIYLPWIFHFNHLAESVVKSQFDNIIFQWVSFTHWQFHKVICFPFLPFLNCFAYHYYLWRVQSSDFYALKCQNVLKQ